MRKESSVIVMPARCSNNNSNNSNNRSSNNDNNNNNNNNNSPVIYPTETGQSSGKAPSKTRKFLCYGTTRSQFKKPESSQNSRLRIIALLRSDLSLPRTQGLQQPRYMPTTFQPQSRKRQARFVAM